MSSNLLRALGLLSALALLTGGSCAPEDFYSSQYKEGYAEGYGRVSAIAGTPHGTEYVPMGKIVPKKQRSDFITDADYNLYLRGWNTGADAAIESNGADGYLQLHRGYFQPRRSGSDRVASDSEP